MAKQMNIINVDSDSRNDGFRIIVEEDKDEHSHFELGRTVLLENGHSYRGDTYEKLVAVDITEADVSQAKSPWKCHCEDACMAASIWVH